MVPPRSDAALCFPACYALQLLHQRPLGTESSAKHAGPRLTSRLGGRVFHRPKTRGDRSSCTINRGAQSLLASPRGLTRPLFRGLYARQHLHQRPLARNQVRQHAGPRRTSRLGGRIFQRLKTRGVRSSCTINQGAQSSLASPRGQTRPSVARVNSTLPLRQRPLARNQARSAPGRV